MSNKTKWMWSKSNKWHPWWLDLHEWFLSQHGWMPFGGKKLFDNHGCISFIHIHVSIMTFFRVFGVSICAIMKMYKAKITSMFWSWPFFMNLEHSFVPSWKCINNGIIFLLWANSHPPRFCAQRNIPTK